MNLRNTSFLAASGIMNNLIGIVSGILLARLLGPEGRGEVASFIFWPALLAGILGLSLHSIATIHIARLNGPLRLRAEALFAKLLLLVALIMAPVAFGFLTIIEPERFISTTGLLALVYVFSEIMRPAILGMDAGRRQYGKLAFFQLFTPLTYLLFLVAFALFGQLSVNEAVFSIVAASLLCVLMRGKDLPTKAQPKEAFFKTILQSSLRLHPAQILELTKQNIDRMIIVLFLPVGQIGLYFVAYTFASAPFVAMQQAFISQLLTDFSANTSKKDTWRQLFKALLILSGVVTALYLALSIFLPIIVPLLVGEQYQTVPIIASMLAIGFAIRTIIEIALTYLKSIRAVFSLITMQAMHIVGFASALFILEPSTSLDVAQCVVAGYLVSLGTAVLLLGLTYRNGQSVQARSEKDIVT